MTHENPPSGEKIRMLLEGMKAEVSAAQLRQKEGIPQSLYEKWMKEIIEEGETWLRTDTEPGAAEKELADLRQENARLKQEVAQLTIDRQALNGVLSRNW